MLLKTTYEDGSNMSHQDIQEEVDTFMFEVGGRMYGFQKHFSKSTVDGSNDSNKKGASRGDKRR